jgi:hypothetical protein
VARIFWWIVALAVFLPWRVAAEHRHIIPLDGEWRFARQEMVGASDPSYVDAGWPVVSVPHSYNADDGEAGGSYYRGAAWYRRHVDLKAVEAGRRYFIEFDGVTLTAQLWLNGRAVGRHDGGYARFRFDVTDSLKAGRNVIAVRVDNSRLPHVAPLKGDFTIFGGIFRPVRLVSTRAVHIDMQDFGGPGVYAHVARLGAVRADIATTTMVRNTTPNAIEAQVTTVIRDAAGRDVARGTGWVRVLPKESRAFRQALAVATPRLWHGLKDPYLYTVESTVSHAGTPSDRVRVPLGIRTVAVDPDRGFLLNGKPYALYGANVSHSGRPGKALVVSDAEIAQDVEIMQEMGVTGLRLTHVQHPAAMYAEGDRRGLLLLTEVPVVDAVSEGPEFVENASRQMRELIKQTYNNPSVVVWGIGNEVREVTPAGNHVLASLHAVAKDEDPSRPTVYAHCCPSEFAPLVDHADLLSYNRYFGWYDGAFGDLGPALDRYHKHLPTKPIAVSEYGAGGSIHQQQDPPDRPVHNGQWHPEQYQTLFHEAYWPQIAARPFIWSAFVWVGFDLASDRRNEGDRAGINDKGLVSYDRATRKMAYYYYQAQWSKTPMAYITSRRFTQRTTPQVEVKVYTNSPSLTLSVDGRSLGTQAPVGGIVRWQNVQLTTGPNRLRVVDPTGTVSDEVTWTYSAAP